MITVLKKLQNAFLLVTLGALASGSTAQLSARQAENAEKDTKLIPMPESPAPAPTEEFKMPPMKPAPEHGPEAMTMEGFPWLPYDLSSRCLWVEATGLWCKRCSEDTKKNLMALNSVESVDVKGSDDAEKVSLITIKLKKDAAVPSDKELSDAIKEAGYTFVKSHPERVLVAEITGAFSSMCQGVIKSGLLEAHEAAIDELAIEISKKGRTGRSWIKIRLAPTAQPMSDAQVQKAISKFNFKLHNTHMLDINGKVTKVEPLPAKK